MTLPIFKNGEPLYTVIYKHEEARSRFTKWAASSRSIQSRIEDNRMMLFDHNTLSLFVVTWNHGWNNLLVWDTYLKRHLYF
jgi:hypothetical protein